MNKFVYIVSHTRFDEQNNPVHGTASELAPLLAKKKILYTYIQHSIFDEHSTYIEDGKKTQWMGLKNMPFPIRLVQEFLITSFWIFRQNKQKSIFIGVDPMNALWGLMYRKLGKVATVVFYTADYAQKRYSNIFLNSFYHGTDRFCIKHADQVWNVSSRIHELRLQQGVNPKRNFYIPNSPRLLQIKKFHKPRNKYTIAIVSHLTKSLDFMSLFKAIKKLKKTYPQIRLEIIGDGPYRTKLEKKVNELQIRKQVIFLGPKKHEDVLNLLQSAGVGIALYTNDFPWTRFGDSMKVREYLACGLAVIISDVPSTADDISSKKAGIVVNKSSEIGKAISSLFSNETSYAIMRRNAFRLAHQYDFSRMIEKTGLF